VPVRKVRGVPDDRRGRDADAKRPRDGAVVERSGRAVRRCPSCGGTVVVGRQRFTWCKSRECKKRLLYAPPG